MITDRDIVINAIAEGCNIEVDPIEDFMQSNLKWVYADADVDEAAQLMKEEQIRRLVVVDRNKKLVGILALGDISTRGEEDLAGDALQDISQPPSSTH